jgi:transposase
MSRPILIKLNAKGRAELEALVARNAAPAAVVRRARVVLLTADGIAGTEIATRLDLTTEAVSRIRRRFSKTGVKGLEEGHRSGRKDNKVPLVTIERVIDLAMSPPPAGRSRWTTRLLGKAVGHASSCISKILRDSGLKPHLARTYKVSRDPAFASKVEDIVGLYLNPPTNAIVLSVDEKTSIQALERTQVPLPLRTGRAVRHTHDYKRHGVVDLFAALEVATGRVTHDLKDGHTGADFLSFMKSNRSGVGAGARNPGSFRSLTSS